MINIRKYPIIYLLFIILIFYSCKKENGQRGVLKTYFPKDNQIVLSEYIIKNDDTIINGKYTVYKYSGEKIKSGIYKNGKKTGPTTFYYDNGNIECISTSKDDKPIETIYNYRNGKIERYLFYDDFGKTAFIIYFDEFGNVDKYKGYPIIETYQYKIANEEQFKTNINQYLKVGDILKYQYLVANIPNAKRSFKVENISTKGTKSNKKITEKSLIESDIEEVLTTKGINKIKALVKYEFKNKQKTVISDTLSFQVEVH
jgi:antitoxin component YwqK of YwqJK toxin-antitoxin module